MSTITTQSTKQAENIIIGEYKALGPAQPFEGDEIILMRCAETIDEVFPNWLITSHLEEDKYIPFDVNVPIELPRRFEMRKSYSIDPPLTEMAKVCSQMMARELCDRKIIPSVIYCSPDFASIETANIIQKYIGPKCGKIKIEGELSTMHNASHVFFGKDHLVQLGYAIDLNNRPLKQISDKVSTTDILNRVKRAFYELTGNVKNALVIVDPLSMRLLSTIFYPIKVIPGSSLDMERSKARTFYPPLCNLTVFKDGEAGMRMYDLSNMTLRSLNCTGFSNDIIPE